MRGGMSRSRAIDLLEIVRENLPKALDAAARSLPPGFPGTVVESLPAAAIARSNRFLTIETEIPSLLEPGEHN